MGVRANSQTPSSVITPLKMLQCSFSDNSKLALALTRVKKSVNATRTAENVIGEAVRLYRYFYIYKRFKASRWTQRFEEAIKV